MVNRFDLERIEGIRQGALAVYNAMKDRRDVPRDVKEFALEIVRRAGNRALDDRMGDLLGIEAPGATG